GLTPEEVQSVRFLPFDYEIEYVCRPDREIVGPKVRKCQRDGTWTAMGHPSRCLRTCPKMHLSLENGQAVPRAMERVPVEGTWTEYSCNPGFRLVGSARSNCTKLGRWSTPKPICELGCPCSDPHGVSLRLGRVPLQVSMGCLWGWEGSLFRSPWGVSGVGGCLGWGQWVSRGCLGSQRGPVQLSVGLDGPWGGGSGPHGG
uniref:Sushi domain-containing protein n=1 Tax=Otus sunia TaxID=257818 RepID=A0A8C8ACD4_9STRI